jgi:hypothetical protein
LRASTTADANGLFSFSNVAPGEYRLFAWKERFRLNAVSADDLQRYDEYAVSVGLEEGGLEQAELEAVPLP